MNNKAFFPQLQMKHYSRLLTLILCDRYSFFVWFWRQGFSVSNPRRLSWNSLCKQGRPQTHRNPPASASQVLGSRACVPQPQLDLFKAWDRLDLGHLVSTLAPASSLSNNANPC